MKFIQIAVKPGPMEKGSSSEPFHMVEACVFALDDDGRVFAYDHTARGGGTWVQLRTGKKFFDPDPPKRKKKS